jgi:sugar lactone lactonase YvrE
VIRAIDLASGTASILAGNGGKGYSGDGGPATKASFHGVFAIDLGPGGRMIYVADLSNRRIRAVDLKTGIVNLVAGNGESGVPKDGADAKTSPLVDPRAVTADAQGNVYILERRGNALRVVDKNGKIRTLVAPGQVKPDLNGPKHLCMDRDGGVVIADAENHLVRKYSPKTRSLVTIAGTGERGGRIVADDPLQTQLNRPHGVTVDARGDLWIADSYNHRVLRVKRDR